MHIHKCSRWRRRRSRSPPLAAQLLEHGDRDDPGADLHASDLARPPDVHRDHALLSEFIDPGRDPVDRYLEDLRDLHVAHRTVVQDAVKYPHGAVTKATTDGAGIGLPFRVVGLCDLGLLCEQRKAMLWRLITVFSLVTHLVARAGFEPAGDSLFRVPWSLDRLLKP